MGKPISKCFRCVEPTQEDQIFIIWEEDSKDIVDSEPNERRKQPVTISKHKAKTERLTAERDSKESFSSINSQPTIDQIIENQVLQEDPGMTNTEIGKHKKRNKRPETERSHKE